MQTVANHLLGWFNVGGLAFCILMSTLMGCISWFGGAIWANSISVIPTQTTQPVTISCHRLLCARWNLAQNNIILNTYVKNNQRVLILGYINTFQCVHNVIRKRLFLYTDKLQAMRNHLLCRGNDTWTEFQSTYNYLRCLPASAYTKKSFVTMLN